ncbi:GNAT family N-acetyltransferase [Actinoplanes sp. NPDC048796]|uniref:GNAT family N-acetyltransferase n=1 Tax=unclassified Actinoplanes TaxID=2626549 RepID=UPI0033CC96F1
MDDRRERARAYRRHHGGAVDGLLMLAVAAHPPARWPAGVEVDVVDHASPPALIRENLDVNEQGFDPMAAPVGDEQAEAFRYELEGARAVTVRAGGRPVAAGMVLPVCAGVTEVAGVATLEPYRRRGYGRIATEALLAAAAGLGADLVVLSTGEPVARRLYERLGFTAVE